ncbi:MAG: hypothetical protein R6X20_06470 [Phycisphaerae bacterium]
MKRAEQAALACAVLLPLLLLTAAGAGHTAHDDAAVITVKGDKPLHASTLREGGRISTNRAYTFTRVPEALRGLASTVNQHKNPATLTVTAETDGAVYTCFGEGDAGDASSQPTPASLNLDGAWAEAGRMVAVVGGRAYGWTIYRTRMKAGQVLTVPPGNRWGAAVLAREIRGLDTVAARPGEGPPLPADLSDAHAAEREAWARPDLADEARRRWHELARQLGDRTWFKRIAGQAYHPAALVRDGDRDPVDVLLRRTTALLRRLREMPEAPDLSEAADELAGLRRRAAKVDPARTAERYRLFHEAMRLRRRVALANPLLDVDRILFVQRHDAGGPFHMCDQYYGCNARPGGGLFVLEDAFGAEPHLRNLLADAAVENGRLEGRRLEGGSFLSPELSFDGRTVYFAWTQAQAKKTYTWTPECCYHVFKVNADGTGLRQLTDGPWDDFDPCVLPSGRVAFISLRRGGYLRCGRHCPTYTLHSMEPDGSDIVPLSYHETHEWHPSVDRFGRIVYTRWDYVDRDTNVAHHIWTCYPDGRDPRSMHGNYPLERGSRPWMEMTIRAVPGSLRYIATTGAHHGHAFGSLVLIDQSYEDDRAMSQLSRLTPEVRFPEAEGDIRRHMIFATPWPLAEDFWLSAYDPAAKRHGLYLADAFGNRTLLYRDASIPSLSPIPLGARPRPPVIPTETTQTVRGRRKFGERRATVAVMDMYDSDFQWPEGAKVDRLRIVQLLPKSTPPPDKPRIGVARQSSARASLGTVPVEADGSVHFEAPVGVPIYFQALDERGMAIQSMRSVTYVHPGERLVCQGCHEPKRRQRRPGGRLPVALRRAPSPIRPDPDGADPFNYVRLVQPVLDTHCVACHKEKKAVDLTGEPGGKYGWTRSYANLAEAFGFYFHVYNGSIKAGVHGGSRTVPGKFGARASRLLEYLGPAHYGVDLPPEAFRRVALWLDLNSEFYGAYEQTDEQARGQVVEPSLE